MKYPLTIKCPPMEVKNLSWFGNPYADREAQQITCDVLTTGPDGQALRFEIIFPKCKIWRDTSLLDRQVIARIYSLASVPSAVWMVEPVTAFSPGNQAIRIGVNYPQEPTVRASLFEGGNIDVLPVASLSGKVVLPDGRQGSVTSTLPRTTGRPVGLGLLKYIVDAVACEGEVDWG